MPFQAYLDHLRAAGASPATLRGTAATCPSSSAGWRGGTRAERADTALLRRYAAYLGTLRYAPATAARKLSAMRGALAWLTSRRVPPDPAAVCRAPSGCESFPRRSGQTSWTLLDGPSARAARAARPGAARAAVRAGCARRRPAARLCDVDSRGADAGARQGRQAADRADRRRSRRGVERLAAHGRPELAGAGAATACSSASAAGRSAVRHPPRSRAGARRDGLPPLAARAPARLRHPSARGRRRSPQYSGAAGPRVGSDDPGLHPGERAPPRAAHAPSHPRA